MLTYFLMLSPHKLRAYRSTHYRFDHEGQTITLHIDTHCTELVTVYAAHRVNCGAFITAWNPYGTQQSSAANTAAQQRLLERLTVTGHTALDGRAEAADGDWPAEHSYFVPGLNHADACAIGRVFNQDAIVWVGADAVPKLVVLR